MLAKTSVRLEKVTHLNWEVLKKISLQLKEGLDQRPPRINPDVTIYPLKSFVQVLLLRFKQVSYLSELLLS